MACRRHWRNVQTKIADGKTAFEKICGELFHGPVISFGAKVSYKPSSKDVSRLHRFGDKDAS